MDLAFWGRPSINQGLLGGAVVKSPSARQCRRHKRHGFSPWVGTIPWRRKWQLTPVFLPGESHGQRSLAGSGPWGLKESDMAGHTHTHTRTTQPLNAKGLGGCVCPLCPPEPLHFITAAWGPRKAPLTCVSQEGQGARLMGAGVAAWRAGSSRPVPRNVDGMDGQTGAAPLCPWLVLGAPGPHPVGRHPLNGRRSAGASH